MMAVTEDDDVNVLVQKLRPKDVGQKKSPAGNGYARNFVTIIIIIISADECHRSDGAQRVEDKVATDVAGMKNQVDALQRGERLRTNQAVRIGNDADLGGCRVARLLGCLIIFGNWATRRLGNLIPRCWPSSPRSSLCIDP